jgi:hypothetical protein
MAEALGWSEALIDYGFSNLTDLTLFADFSVCEGA